MVRAVLLDYDGTLITFDRKAAFVAALGPHVHAATDAGLALRLAEEDRCRAREGRHDRRALFGEVDPGLDAARAERAFWETVTATTRHRPGARALVDHCRKHGIRLGLLTDEDGAPGLKARRLARDPLVAAFDAVVIGGHTVPESKPDPRPFRVILDRLNTAPTEAIMVGDKVVVDLEPARGLGLCALWFPADYPGEWTPRIRDLEEVIGWL